MDAHHSWNKYFIPALSVGWGDEQLLCPPSCSSAPIKVLLLPWSQHLLSLTCPASPAQPHLPHLTCLTPPAQPHLPSLTCPISPAQPPAGAKSTAGKVRLRPQEQSSLSQQQFGQRNQGIFLSKGSQTAPSFDPGHRAGFWRFSFPSLCCSLLSFSFLLYGIIFVCVYNF